MKKILYVAMSALMLTSCYEDKGNYDYHFDDLNKVDISDVTYTPSAYKGVSGSVIEIQMPMTEDKVQRVEANLKQTLADNYDNLDFTWYSSYTVTETNPKTGRETTKTLRDTLHTRGYVDLKFPVNTDRSYNLMMVVKDKTTDLDYYAHLNVKTRLLFKNSLFFLHQKGSETYLGNVEKIGSSLESRSNAYQTAFPTTTDNVFSNAIKLGFTTYISSRTATAALMVFNADGRGYSYNTLKGLQLFDVPLVPTGSTPFVASRLVDVGSSATFNKFDCLISRDGQFYIGKMAPYFMAPGAASYDNTLHPGDYQVTAATVTADNFVLWDAKNNRFIYQSNGDYVPAWSMDGLAGTQSSMAVKDAHVDFSSLGSLSPVGKQAVYAFIASHSEFFEDAKPQFIFKDNADNFYLYELTSVDGGKNSKAKATRGGDDEDASSSEAAYTITGKRLPDFHPGSNLASITYNPWFSTNYIFYAKDDQVIRHNLSNGDEEVIYTAPVGYTVSIIKFRTYDSESNSTLSSNFGDLGLYLSIGMNKGDNGAVAEIKLTTSADVDESYTMFCDKDADGNAFGKILDVQFAHMYSFSKDSQ